MNISDISATFGNIIAEIYAFMKYEKLSYKKKKLLKKNKQYKDAYVKKRCFILGNGPSLNSFDLSKLCNEYVFCVNDFLRYDKFMLAKPNFYLLADPKFFDLNENGKDETNLLSKFEGMLKDFPDIRLFVPISSLKVVENYAWRNKINYFYPVKKFSEKHLGKYDFSTKIASMQAVVQYAILLAIYMGFSEIYLLGTEQTNILGNIKAYMNENEVAEYAFSMNEEEKQWKNSKLTSYSLPETLRGYARIFELYEKIGEYCKRNDVKLRNCSPGSLIQGIEKIDIDELLFE